MMQHVINCLYNYKAPHNPIRFLHVVNLKKKIKVNMVSYGQFVNRHL
jgi:hypothetical protein